VKTIERKNYIDACKRVGVVAHLKMKLKEFFPYTPTKKSLAHYSRGLKII
jgi:hypothetical protein